MESRSAFTVVVIVILVLLGAGFIALGSFPPAAPRPSPVTTVIPTSAVGAG
ncbi:MAG: hypothetical protein ACREFP_09375 [Acetobacteraceae bacterium]